MRVVEKKQCIVCHKITEPENNKIITCPFCDSLSHLECISNWLLTYNACPRCQNKFLYPNLMLMAQVSISNDG